MRNAVQRWWVHHKKFHWVEYTNTKTSMLGGKYIKVTDAERAQMVLFDMKGPGELGDPREAS
ncbi:MAG: hypothetical protein HN936_03500 [Bacteroidetes bacterium]|jgi:hypothetical protein|nr:hypothetical protein [Bacteroidota bacterium]MBT4400363.1 hypothetical protein [Bacteroidota bacterium]MBT7092286.1 hypothetical protein [Bacteroidota bacterium]MBT7462704.1 hypothetical protein [Bacteroidota bacterium]